MSNLTLSQSISAVAANCLGSFLGIGGTPPYTYSVIPFGAGGTINSTTGAYVAPVVASSSPKQAYDYIQVTDSLGATATARILVGTPLLLMCDIIQNGMNLATDQTWIWDQKIFVPTDSRLYVGLSVPSCKPFGNINSIVSDPVQGMIQIQATNMSAIVDIDIISRGPDARDRKEQVLLALNSVYAEQQQEANSFYYGKLPAGSQFINLSNLDGAAIPYRYKISFRMQYMYSITSPAQYFGTFSPPTLYLNNP